MRFDLLPFAPNPDQPEIHGSVSRVGSRLSLSLSQINRRHLVWPKSAITADRRDNLWQSTCFECFVGCPSQDSYLEINACPSGHWQAYYFSHYRSQAKHCDSVRVSVTTSVSSKFNLLSCLIDIEHPDFVTADWEISPSAVLEYHTGEQAFFALAHPQNVPDFHLAELRKLELPGD